MPLLGGKGKKEKQKKEKKKSKKALAAEAEAKQKAKVEAMRRAEEEAMAGGESFVQEDEVAATWRAEEAGGESLAEEAAFASAGAPPPPPPPEAGEQSPLPPPPPQEAAEMTGQDEVAAEFARYNTNGDGMLDLHELRALLDDANFHVDDSYVHGLEDEFGKWDADGSGGIELGEFRELWAQLDLGTLLEEARASGRWNGSHRSHRSNGSHRSHSLAAAAFASAGAPPLPPPPPPEAAEMTGQDEVAAAFARYNTNGDGMLDLHELRILLDDADYQVDAAYVHGLQDVFGRWDADGSGGIELGEFRELWAQLDLGTLLEEARASGSQASGSQAARVFASAGAPPPPPEATETVGHVEAARSVRSLRSEEPWALAPAEMAGSVRSEQSWAMAPADVPGKNAGPAATAASRRPAAGASIPHGRRPSGQRPELVCDRWHGLDEMFRGKTLRQIFAIYDTDGSGTIGQAEISAWFAHAADAEEDAEELAAAALEQFAGGDSVLDFGEFCEMWTFMHAEQERVDPDQTAYAGTFREEFSRHNERLQQQELLAKRLVEMPQLATGPARASDYSADPVQNMLACKRFLNAEDFAAAAGALRVAALDLVQPPTGSVEQHARVFDMILEYRLGFGIFTACRRLVKYRRHHAREGRTEKVAGFGVCLAVLADALGCWCFVSKAMDNCHRIMFLQQAVSMHIDLGEFVSGLRLIGFIKQIDRSADVSKLSSKCKAHMTNHYGLQSRVTAGGEFEAVMASLEVAIDGCTHLGIDPAEPISLKGLIMAHHAQTLEELRACKDELHKAKRLSASFGDIRKQAEVLLNLGLVFCGITNEHQQALKVAREVRELDARAVHLGKSSLFRIKAADPPQPQRASARGAPPHWSLPSGRPAARSSRPVDMTAHGPAYSMASQLEGSHNNASASIERSRDERKGKPPARRPPFGAQFRGPEEIPPPPSF